MLGDAAASADEVHASDVNPATIIYLRDERPSGCRTLST